jgi:hypothetical protein
MVSFRWKRPLLSRLQHGLLGLRRLSAPFIFPLSLPISLNLTVTLTDHSFSIYSAAACGAALCRAALYIRFFSLICRRSYKPASGYPSRSTLPAGRPANLRYQARPHLNVPGQWTNEELAPSPLSSRAVNRSCPSPPSSSVALKLCGTLEAQKLLRQRRSLEDDTNATRFHGPRL